MAVVDSKVFLREAKKPSSFPAVVLLMGEEETLMREALASYQSSFVGRFGDANPDFNRDTLHGDRDDAPRILDSCGTLPFGSEKKFVVVHRVEKLSESSKAALAEYCRSPNPSTCLVLVWMIRPNATALSSNLAEAAASKGVLAKFWSLYEEQRPDWVREEAGRMGKRIAREACALLAQEGGDTLGELRSEIEKLVLFVGDRPEIGLDDVKETMSFRRNSSVWDFTEKFEGGEVREAGRILERCLDQDEEPVKLLNLLARSCRTMADPAAPASGWGPGGRRTVRKMPAGDPRIAKLFAELKRSDLMMKSGHGPEAAPFEKILYLSGQILKGRPK